MRNLQELKLLDTGPKANFCIKFLKLKDFGAKGYLSSDEESNQFLQEIIATGLNSNSDI